MTPITRTHNAYHLGDQFVHLNFLRQVAREHPGQQFVHFAQWQYLPELRPLIEDIKNISLAEFNYRLPSDSIDAWRGADSFWYHHPDRNDFVKFHVESWFPRLAKKMGVENPIKTREDMLFSYPALKGAYLPTEINKPFDVLVINSPPGSGQFQGYDQFALGEISIQLANKGISVITTDPVRGRRTSADYVLADKGYVVLPGTGPVIDCTKDFNLNCTQIGALSLLCHTILMVSTGPTWPTFNVWNYASIKNRIILLDSERVELSPNTVHCNSVGKAADELRRIGLL